MPAADDGERRHATIVISDLSGYTAMNERLDPEEVEEIMASVKRQAQKAIERNGGIVNQFIGDEVIGLFGIPIARRDDAIRAVRAALELHRAVQELSAENAPRVGRDILMHSGISTGLVVARRSDSREGRYLLTGDTINTAARLLKLASDGEIIVGQDTWREVAGKFEAEARPPTEVKGKEKPVVPWLIHRECTAEDQPSRPFFGRAAECAHFDALLRDCAASRKGQFVVIRGDPGIGKTRLTEEFLRRAETFGFARQRALVLDFSAERGGDAIRTLARGLANDVALHDRAPEQRVFIADLLDTELEAELQSLAAAMSEEVRALGIRRALCDLVRKAAQNRPQLLLIEDLHWADEWVIAHLSAIAEIVCECPLLLVGTTRYEGDPASSLAVRNAPEIIDLRPLSTEEMERLAAEFAGISDSLARTLVERAEGNPLFLEQLLLNADQRAEHDLPSSIQGLVLARLDRLEPADRAALQAASVLGQRFSLETLRWLVDDRKQDCRGLLEHFLVRPEGDGFLFGHALIRDGAYAALLKSRRRQLHGRAAQWYQERDLAASAEHLERAEDPGAPDAYLAAGIGEARRYRYEQALGLIDRGAGLAHSDLQRHSLGASRAGLLLELGRGHEALEAWRDALAIAPDDAARCRVYIGMASAMRLVDLVPDGFAALEKAEPLTVAPGMELERSRLHHLRGNLCFGLGRIGECLREHQAALASALEAGSAEAEANALGGLGDAYYMSGRMRSAYHQFGRCVELARQGGLGRIEVANLHMVGWSAHALCLIREALQIADECLRQATAVSHRRVEVLARTMGAYVGGWIVGEIAKGEENLEVALQISQNMGAKRFEGQVRTYQAQLALRAGDRQRAQELAGDARDFCHRHGMEFFGPVALGLVGRLSEDPEEASRCNREATALLDSGAVAHCHFEFYAHAIEGALDRGAWMDAEHYCTRLERYTSSEPLDLMDFQIARGRILSVVGRGERGPAVVARLDTLANKARAEGLNLWLPALERADSLCRS